jgi:hypothetical protein
VVFKCNYRLLVDVGLDVFELTVQVVELKHQEIWFVLIEVVLRRQVDGQVEFVLDLHDVIQI